jgi:dephospho-CoA kinase
MDMMLNFKHVLGFTGTMGAGKSTLVQEFKDRGIYVWDADQQVAALYEDPETSEVIGKSLGFNGPVTKAQIAELITNDPDRLPRVEGVVGKLMDVCLYTAMKTKRSPFTVLEVPLLYESCWDHHCDFVVNISCDANIRIQRIMARPGMTEEKMRLLQSRQWLDSARNRRSHFVIDNSDNLELARSQVRFVIAKLENFYE